MKSKTYFSQTLQRELILPIHTIVKSL